MDESLPFVEHLRQGLGERPFAVDLGSSRTLAGNPFDSVQAKKALRVSTRCPARIKGVRRKR